MNLYACLGLLALGLISGCSLGPPQPEMIFVEGGMFRMGCTEEQAEICLSDETLVAVELDNFWIGRFEVTNALFAEFLNDAGNQVEGGASWYAMDKYAQIEEVDGRFRPKPGLEAYAVASVSWYGASAYADWLSAKTGRRFRLPTEAEWEYAARGGPQLGASVYSGGDDIEGVAWCDDYAADSGSGWGFQDDYGNHKVGGKMPNALGIHDMSGNLSEWCADFYDNVLSGGRNPSGAAYGSLRVIRGGSWDNVAEECRVSARGRSSHVSRFGVNKGFRVVREP